MGRKTKAKAAKKKNEKAKAAKAAAGEFVIERVCAAGAPSGAAGWSAGSLGGGGVLAFLFLARTDVALLLLARMLIDRSINWVWFQCSVVWLFLGCDAIIPFALGLWSFACYACIYACIFIHQHFIIFPPFHDDDLLPTICAWPYHIDLY